MSGKSEKSNLFTNVCEILKASNVKSTLNSSHRVLKLSSKVVSLLGEAFPDNELITTIEASIDQSKLLLNDINNNIKCNCHDEETTKE